MRSKRNPYLPVSRIKTDKLPFCPVTAKDNRVLTKHFTNLIYHKDRNLISLLGYLIYESGSDNRIEYSHLLVEKYCLSVKSVTKFYEVKVTGKKLIFSNMHVRKLFKRLISEGYLLAHGGNLYINPMYSYRSDYVSKSGYRKWTELYQTGDIDKIVPAWVKIISIKVKGKKDDKEN